MAGIVAPSWSEVQRMDETTLIAIGIIKAQQQGDEFIFDHEEEDEDGVTRYGIWKSKLDERKKQSQSGRVSGVRNYER
jgi:hypothetical protein